MTELSARDWQLAIERGIISSQQRDALFELARANGQNNDGASDDEPFRLIGGGNDVFVSVGILLLFAGISFLLNALFGMDNRATQLMFIVAVWLVAEFITRQKRMKLSSTILAVLFCLVAGEVLFFAVRDSFSLNTPQTPVALMAMRDDLSLSGLAFFGGLIGLALAYFWRFRVPILAGIVALSVTALAFLFAALYLYDGVLSQSVAINGFDDLVNLLRNALYVPLFCGMLVFGLGVAFDLYDRERISTWSDCAFWLHIVSAPLLVHPLFIMATGQDLVVGTLKPELMAAVLLGLLIASFIYVALIIDRRSLLVPTLGYFGSLGVYAMVSDSSAAAGIPPIALILLLIGGLIIVFGAGWQRIRAMVMRLTLPKSAIERLPAIRI